ncbi:purine-cytosine permease family protein [Nocardiopsis metallicus]|uniref:Purine-cytosine permease-like protein n=1 Tax=Nocardiopsis metallicus TaxID=179819 RepID=A0A840WIW9_9ACTN|nr:cytosine permease [Nocardiopsis metallicus]MBB5490018.1 purine-cytosine permease-like protein [Nocardiopsis metallicus]
MRSTNPGHTASRGVDRPGSIETRGIDQVPAEERHGSPRELFVVWAAPNVSYLSIIVGAALVLMGLSLIEALLVIVVGNLFWLLTGFIGVSGTASGTTGSVISRAMYGVRGNKVLVAISGWLIAALYLGLNWAAASVAGFGLTRYLGLPETAPVEVGVVCVIAAATILVSVYGHATIVRLYSVLTILLLAVFAVLTVLILANADFAYVPAEPLTGWGRWMVLTIAFTIVASTSFSYVNSPDLARYLPRDSSRVGITLWSAAGGFVPSVVFTAAGALAATGLDMSDPQGALESIMPGWFVPVFVIAVVLNTIANNGVTAYSAGLAMQSVGVPLPRVPAVLVIGLMGTALAVAAVSVVDFMDAVNMMLELVVVLTVPFMTVFATDVVMRRNRYLGEQLHDQGRGGPFWYRGGVNPAGAAATAVGVVASALCVSTEIWAGPVSEALHGLNLAVPVGLVVSAALYWLLSRGSRSARAEQISETPVSSMEASR